MPRILKQSEQAFGKQRRERQARRKSRREKVPKIEEIQSLVNRAIALGLLSTLAPVWAAINIAVNRTDTESVELTETVGNGLVPVGDIFDDLDEIRMAEILYTKNKSFSRDARILLARILLSILGKTKAARLAGL